MLSTKPMRKIEGNNVSEKYKFEWIAPERTGSRKMAEVLTYYGFKYNNSPVFSTGTFNYSHFVNADYLRPNYKIICGARNPYGRVYSIFKNFYAIILDKSKVGFKEFLKNHLLNEMTLKMIMNPSPNIQYDYVIRLEHMVDDFIKLPFIFDVLTKSQLEMICTHGKNIEDWEQYYDQEMKEIVYGLTEYQFKRWGYHK
jgi:hypothetical protein